MSSLLRMFSLFYQLENRISKVGICFPSLCCVMLLSMRVLQILEYIGMCVWYFLFCTFLIYPIRVWIRCCRSPVLIAKWSTNTCRSRWIFRRSQSSKTNSLPEVSVDWILDPVSSKISDFMPCAHAQSNIVHIKNADKTDDWGLGFGDLEGSGVRFSML